MPSNQYCSTLKGYSVPKVRGFTLIELLVVLAIAGILASLAIPSYNDAVSRAKVRDAAQTIYGLLLQAKNEGPIRDASLSVSFDSSHWCVGLSTLSPCDCTLTAGTGACTLDVSGTQVLHTITRNEFPDIAISENFLGVRTTFSHIRRRASPAGTITVSAGGQSLFIKVNPVGRIRICADEDSPVAGYPSC